MSDKMTQGMRMPDTKNKPTYRGHPPFPLQEPIGRSMDEIAQTVLQANPKREDEWEYLLEHEAERERPRAAKGE